MTSQRPIPTTDRISDLPDSILTHILSILPTKHAATTSILSKRWKPLWLSILTLDIDDQTFKHFHSFIQFIFSIIFSFRDNTLTVPSFRFKCRRHHSLFQQNDFDQIFHFIMQKRGVENLTLQLPNKNVPIKLLPRILSFNMLQVLKFENVEIGDYDHVDFPRVKTLHLSNVSFKYREYIVKFLLGFPILENLQTELHVYRPMQKFETSIALPNLINVRICDSYTPLSLVCKAKTLYVQQTLWLVCSIEFPMFHNLTHLELGYYATRLCYTKCAMLLGILPYFPKLQHFIIQDGVDAMKLEYKHWKDPPINTVPECLSSQLKTCLIRGYRDTRCEFEFVKYIMKHSQVLETMAINSIGLTKNETLVKLSSCIRGSTTCKLLFD